MMARVHRFGVLLLVVLLHAPSIDAFAAKAKSSSKGKKAKASSAKGCLLYTSPSPRDGLLSRMPSSA